SLLEARPGINRQQAELEWFRLNEAIRTGNAAIRTEAEGGPSGSDRILDAIKDYVPNIYAQNNPPISRSVADGFHVPESWKEGAADLRAAKLELWTAVVAPYCNGCHRVSTMDFTEYPIFERLAADSAGASLLYRYLLEDPTDPQHVQYPWMPQAELMSKALREDARAFAAIEDWLEAVRN
ncbi:MAG: hypothetical protein WBV82_06940, partial [Myxococcaceae bacterium]